MKYTSKQLHSKTNDELNEIVAQAQGFIKIPSGNDIETGLYGVTSNNETTTTTFRYLPTARTTEGKAQAFGLMIECELEFSSAFKGTYKVYSLTDGSVFAEDKHPQRAIVIASILYLQNRKEKQNETS